MTFCKSCGAKIKWATTERGKLIPLDVGEIEDGNLTIYLGVARARTDEDVQIGRAARRSHFASCPQASLFRRT